MTLVHGTALAIGAKQLQSRHHSRRPRLYTGYKMAHVDTKKMLGAKQAAQRSAEVSGWAREVSEHWMFGTFASILVPFSAPEVFSTLMFAGA